MADDIQIGGANSNNNSESEDLDTKMLEDRTYPSPEDPNFQLDMYLKRDFNIHVAGTRKKMDTYAEIKKYRDNICAPREVKYSEQQILLSNFINPDTPYRGVLIYHGTGVGKSGAGIAIAEKFKPQVERYNTQIYVLIPGPLHKTKWLNEIIKFTGETYLKNYYDGTLYINENEQEKIKKNAHNAISQYYRIIPFRSFYNKVSGEKIIERKEVSAGKFKKTYVKTETGEYARDQSIDRIHNLSNTLLIIDEAHGITGNEYGDAIRKIIKSSVNLKIILMTATPMKNKADDIIELLNFIRPQNYQIGRDEIFLGKSVHQIEFKPDGRELLRKYSRGYVSFLRGADPLTFAERVDVGEIPPGLSFTKVIRCQMLDFQLNAYNSVADAEGDSLNKKSESVANFAFPGFIKGKNSGDMIGYYGPSGMNEIKNQLKNNAVAINKKVATTILAEYNIDNSTTLMYLVDNKILGGDFFYEKYLKHFSIKFYTALRNINDVVFGKKGNGLIFIYSNLVKVGVDLFREVLLRNGYLEYSESTGNYNIQKDTRCYYCDFLHGNHAEHTSHGIPQHTFFPATFISITGKTDETFENIQEEQIDMIDNVFNKIENKDGKFIKIILGSKVMNEGFTLHNVKEVHILDVHYNLQKVDQAIGRGIRWCVHYNMMTEDNPYPKVEIYKYVVSLKSGLSSEEDLYKKAEQKYKIVKETERILQEEAIDCPLNRNNNIFIEELEKYKNCGGTDNPCPAICGYMSCNYKCGDKLLNSRYYDPESNVYKKVEKQDLDYSTYDITLARDEIDYAKNKIKELYKLDYVYDLDTILKYVKKSYTQDKQELFDNFYVYQALNDLIPITTNDHNNFVDTVIDKLNRPGYLIYRGKYYIFNQFNEEEDVTMYYRRKYDPIIPNKINIKNYITGIYDINKYSLAYAKNNKSDAKKIMNPQLRYDFESAHEYYENREEFEYVGIIDQVSEKNISFGKEKDEFKIRKKRPKVLVKKREVGVPSYKGSVCGTSKHKQMLEDIAKNLDIDIGDFKKRSEICDMINDKLFNMEKYSTSKQKNKLTYLIIPANHPTIPFPLNLEDRMKHILNDIQNRTKMIVDAEIKTTTPVIAHKIPGIKYVSYVLTFSNAYDKFVDIMTDNGAKKEHGKWVIRVE
uniref:Helicase ATP-binding domain-containing protein n=1 Tax=viral metagenome TaxID=1070528 RepID=A0A6C0CB62_9ZZZZ